MSERMYLVGNCNSLIGIEVMLNPNGCYDILLPIRFSKDTVNELTSYIEYCMNNQSYIVTGEEISDELINGLSHISISGVLCYNPRLNVSRENFHKVHTTMHNQNTKQKLNHMYQVMNSRWEREHKKNVNGDLPTRMITVECMKKLFIVDPGQGGKNVEYPYSVGNQTCAFRTVEIDDDMRVLFPPVITPFTKTFLSIVIDRLVFRENTNPWHKEKDIPTPITAIETGLSVCGIPTVKCVEPDLSIGAERLFQKYKK